MPVFAKEKTGIPFLLAIALYFFSWTVKRAKQVSARENHSTRERQNTFQNDTFAKKRKFVWVSQ